MSEAIVSYDVRSLIDQWLEQEQNGEQFSVPFDIAWQIAGYSRKDSAKRKLMKLNEGTDFHRDVEMVKRPQGGGAKSEVFFLTCDAMKHMGLMAETQEGYQIRQYFIEAEKKWKLVEKVDPAFAQQIELMKLQSDIAKANASMMSDQRFIMERSQVILDLHGPQMLALIQGRPDAVVEKIEKVTETVICQGDRKVSFTGKSTAELGRELGFKTGKEFERWLTKHGYQDKICEGLRAIQAPYIPVEYIADIKRLWSQTRKTNGTQLMLGE
jgi:hypothetical protein